MDAGSPHRLVGLRGGVERGDLHDAATGLGEQEQHPLGLLVARSAVAKVAAELAGNRQDAGHDRVLDDLFFVGGFDAGPGPLARFIEAGVLDSQRQPTVASDRARQIGTDAVPPMSTMLFLRSTEPIVKLHLVAALGRIGDSQGTLPIMQYLGEDQDERGRGTVVLRLVKSGATRRSRC